MGICKNKQKKLTIFIIRYKKSKNWIMTWSIVISSTSKP